MSSERYTPMSTPVITIICASLILLAGCFRGNRPTEAGQVSDRLMNFLINHELPIGEPASPLRSDLQRTSDWVRAQLEADSTQHFYLDIGTNSFTGLNTKEKRILTPKLFQRLYHLNTFFQMNAAVDRNIFKKENVSRLIKRPESAKEIFRMVQLDRSEELSETGGVVTYDSKADQLNFRIIEPDNARWVRRLSAYEDPVLFASELKRIQSHLPYLKVRADRTIAIITKETDDKNTQIKAMQDFLELLRYSSRYSYILDQETQYASIAEQNISGIYMGVFHVHPPDNTPSMEDKLGSILRKNFVLVPRKEFIDVHYLDFTGDLAVKPSVIQVRHSDN